MLETFLIYYCVCAALMAASVAVQWPANYNELYEEFDGTYNPYGIAVSIYTVIILRITLAFINIPIYIGMILLGRV